VTLEYHQWRSTVPVVDEHIEVPAQQCPSGVRADNPKPGDLNPLRDVVGAKVPASHALSGYCAVVFDFENGLLIQAVAYPA
jgi:hypothetical protein